MEDICELPLISVIMCVHNEGRLEELELAVESILHQTYPNLEFIICDNASEESARRLLERYREADRRVVLIRNDDNRGVGAALNQCIAAACGTYIARMDGDDISAPNRLEEEYRFLEAHKEYAFVGCNADLIEHACIWGRRRMPERPAARDFLPYSPYIHPTILGRREFFCRDFGYPVSKRTWRCEDLELFMRRHGQGMYGYNLQQSLYYYREDTMGYSRRKFRYSLAEALVRLQGYGRLHILRKGGLVYWLKPVAVGFIPKQSYRRWKRKQALPALYRG